MSISKALLRSLRPHQWVKNVLVFGGLAFTGRWHRATSGAGVGAVLDWSSISHAVSAFVIFCLLSSAGYLINDVRDREADRLHPEKCRRPIASGALPVSTAIWAALIMFAAAAAGSLALSRAGGTERFGYTALAYLVLTNWYSFQLKAYVIIDVLTIASLFVLRAVAGCYAVPEPPSHWLIVCTLFGALFIGLCKRRAELVETLVNETETRSVLDKYHTVHGYAAGLLDQMIQMAGTATIITYSLYTFFRPQEIGMAGEQGILMLTIPFVVYGVFRYLYLVHKKDIGQKPELLFKDRAMLINFALWALVVVFATRGRSF